jgi:glycosyltransferase involved in cell wall biosynthesis
VNVELSVVLPFHRVDDFLHQALDSVLASSFRDFELIAVADGDVKEEISILSERYKADTRVKFVLNRGRGLVDGLNTGIELALGIYIARMDSDDLCAPGRFAEQLNVLRVKSRVSAVGTQVQYVCQHSSVLGVSRYPSHVTNGVFSKPALPQIAHPTAMFRKAQWKQVGGYRKRFLHVEDLDLWNRLLEVGRIENLPTVGLSYRVHSGQISSSNANAQITEAYRADIFDCLGIFPDSQSWKPTELSKDGVAETLRWNVGNVVSAMRQATLRKKMRAKQIVGYFVVRDAASIFAGGGGLRSLFSRPLRMSYPAWVAICRLLEFPLSTTRFLAEVASQKRQSFGPKQGVCPRCSEC